MATETKAMELISAEDLLSGWQAHRRLTRKVIAAFPGDKLFEFSVGGMRPFGEMAQELTRMCVPVVVGVATGEWKSFEQEQPRTKDELLKLWDVQTEDLNARFPTITEERFRAVDKAFGEWPMPGLTAIQYAIDNEIHHRGEGYVYLRAMGIEPPPFYDRG